MNSRANAVRLCSNAILIANALDEIAKPIVADSEGTCVGIRCRLGRVRVSRDSFRNKVVFTIIPFAKFRAKLG